MGRVIHTGQALVDETARVPGLPERGGNVMAVTFERYAAGACNILIAAARSGATAVHAGATGTGPNGDLIRDALAREGITVSAPPVPDLDTGICFVMVEPTAERTFVTTLGAERQITAGSLQTSDPRPGDLVCVTGYSLAVETTRDPLLQWLNQLEPGVEVVLDPGAAFATLPRRTLTEMLAHTTVWSSNAQEALDLANTLGIATAEAMQDTATALRAVLPPGAVVIVWDGPAGCAVAVDGSTTVVKGYPQRAVDTNGAGDVHTGALVARRVQGEEWVEACRHANAAAAIKVTRVGPASAPTTTEVKDFLDLYDHR